MLSDQLNRAEVLHHTGVLDNVPALSEEQSDMLVTAKNTVMRRTKDFRTQVHRRLSRDSIGYLFEKEKIGALGFASGAFIGTMF